MYAWIWRHLPGNVWVRIAISLVLVLAIVYALFNWIFPWAEPMLPFSDVTVDGGNVDDVQPTGGLPGGLPG
ncbi:hypothetical protein [Streptodolium elevatio]|uniref:Uncharacterized protein n=1 Tax=Streptodolium elevatio TaxID=3157996 RepID=A0ABV3DK79_9ACTN